MSYLIVTKIPTIYNSFMSRIQMSLKVDFPTCLTVTMITTIYNSFMHIFFMLLGCFYELTYSHISHNYIWLLHAQILHVVVSGLLSCLKVTKTTAIYNTFMKIFYMLLKSVFVIFLIVTILTTICNFFMETCLLRGTLSLMLKLKKTLNLNQPANIFGAQIWESLEIGTIGGPFWNFCEILNFLM